MSSDEKQQIIEFLKARNFCIIATVGPDAQPEAAFVGYASNDIIEIVIGTSKASRKYQNIVENPKTALVIADTTGEIQYEGRAVTLDTKAYLSLIENGQFKPLPGFDKYRNDPNQVWLRITPTWIRFIQHGDVDTVTEHTEFA